MTRVLLTGGAYQARSIIANAQTCINLFPERNPDESQPAAPVTHYQTPGLKLLLTLPNPSPTGVSGTGITGLYTASDETIWAVVANKVLYRLKSDWSTYDFCTNLTPGTILGAKGSMSVMADNGTNLVVTNRSTSQTTVNLQTLATSTLSGLQNAQFCDYIDTYLLFNADGTPQFFSTYSNSLTLDPLWTAGKTSSGNDALQALAVAHRQIWLIGLYNTELWVDAGAANFPFQIQPGTIIDYGMDGWYSLAKHDDSVFWLSKDRRGDAMILRGQGLSAKRVSNHFIENWMRDQVTTDTIAYCYQQDGHAFYVINFPTADATWAYDITTGQWHRRGWTDPNTGILHRHRVQCATFSAPYSFKAGENGTTVGGDWQNNNLYALDPDTYTDNGAPIFRQRDFPHLIADGRRVTYQDMIVDMSVGTTITTEPFLNISWSDDRGATFGTPITTSMGAAGATLTSMKVNRLGMARDRVFRLNWNANADVALQGAWISAEPADS